MNTKQKLILSRGTVRKGGGLQSSAVSAFNKALEYIPVGKLVNTAIDALPIELHLPGGYQYCGPGTKLKDRLARGDPGINKLDEACKLHDIAYSKYSDSERRSIADRALAEKAWQRVKSSDAGLGERTAALAVAAAMKAKTSIGGGSRRRRSKKVKVKRGGQLKKNQTRSKKGRRSIKSKKTWLGTQMGKGLYLRPYQSAN